MSEMVKLDILREALVDFSFSSGFRVGIFDWDSVRLRPFLLL